MKRRFWLLLALCTCVIGSALGQTITVKGVVVDENDDPVISATVRLKNNPSVGALTNLYSTELGRHSAMIAGVEGVFHISECGENAGFEDVYKRQVVAADDGIAELCKIVAGSLEDVGLI